MPELGFLAMQSFLEVVSTTVSDLFNPSSAPGEDGHKALFEWFMANFAGILKTERQKGASNALRRSAYYDRRRADAAAAADNDAAAVSAPTETTSKGKLSSSGDYVNGSAVTWKRVQAAQVADLKVAICGCGSFAKCLAGFDTFSASDVEDILAQILACVCIFQKSERFSSTARQDDSGASQSQSQRESSTGAGSDEPDRVEPSSSLTSVASLVLQLQLREGLRKDFLPVLLRACRDFILQVGVLAAWYSCVASCCFVLLVRWTSLNGVCFFAARARWFTVALWCGVLGSSPHVIYARTSWRG